ncbi:MAG: mechanosensitive ion channel family protein [Atopostipes sp.]|nr:mechanosensitive ion channel family protein [Atopostipes sp.]
MFYLAESSELTIDQVPNPSLFEELISSFDWQAVQAIIFTVAIRLLFVLLLFYILKKISVWAIDLFFEKYFKNHPGKANRNETVYRVTFNIFNTVYYFFLIYTVLEIFNFPVGTLLASAGVVGLAVSLGAQGFVSDLVNGFTMLFEKQIEIGDEVELGDIEGDVINVSLRTTQVKDFDGTLHFIPNREISIISNRSKLDMRALVNIRFYPGTDLEKVRRIIEETNDRYIPQFPEITIPPEEILFSASDRDQLTLRVVIYTEPGEQYDISFKFFEFYMEALTENGIDLPYGDIDLK